MVLISGAGLEKLKNNKTALNWLVICFFSVIAITFIISLDSGAKDLGRLIEDIIQFKEKPDYFSGPFLLLNALILSGLLLFFILLKNKFKKTSKLLLYLVAIDLIIQTQITAPTTMVFPEKSIADFNAFYKKLPESIDQTPLTTPLKDLNGYHKDYGPYPVWRNVGTFTKQISPKGHNATQFQSFNKLEHNLGLQNICLNPLIFIAKNTVDSAQNATLPNTVWGTTLTNPNLYFKKKEIQRNAFYFEIVNTSDKPGLVVLNQNFHHLWKAFCQDREIKIKLVNDGLMGFEIPPNFNSNLQINFDSPKTKISFFISLFTYITIGIVLMFNRKKQLKKAP
jgi:hypothetical protein